MLVFKQALIAIQDKLKLTSTPIAFIDLWNEQINMYRDEYTIPMPAVFIEFLPTSWITIGKGPEQHGYGTIKIHIAQHIITDSASVDGTNLPTQQDTLLRFDLLQDVHNVLQDFNTVYFDELDRVGSTLDHNHDGYILDAIEYKTILRDNVQSTTNQVYNNIVPLPDVEVIPNTVPPHNSTNTGGYTIP